MRVTWNPFGLSCFQRLNDLCCFVVFIAPPSQYSFFDNLLAECEIAHLQCPHVVVLGDVNADLLKPSCSQTKLLLPFMKQLQLVDLVYVLLK